MYQWLRILHHLKSVTKSMILILSLSWILLAYLKQCQQIYPLASQLTVILYKYLAFLPFQHETKNTEKSNKKLWIKATLKGNMRRFCWVENRSSSETREKKVHLPVGGSSSISEVRAVH